MKIWQSTNSEDWERSGLDDYLLYDRWRTLPAFYVLAGYHYDAEQDHEGNVNIKYALNDRVPIAIQKGFDDFDSFDSDEYTEAVKEASSMKKNFNRLYRFWMNNQCWSESQSPKVVIEWALSKHIHPAWLDWAIESGLYTPKHEAAQPAQIITENTLDDTGCVELLCIDPESLGRREQQLEIVLAVIAALKFEPLQIPDTGKAAIKQACLTRPRLFTDSAFGHAWKSGVKAGLFKLANHEKYSS